MEVFNVQYRPGWWPVSRAGAADGSSEASAKRDTAGGWLLAAASILLLALAIAQGYVSYRAQYSFIHAIKHESLASTLESLGLDTAAVIFALLGLAQARLRRSAAVERLLNLACVSGSLVMNAMSANFASGKSVAAWVLPAALYAAASDRLIAVVRRRALAAHGGDQDGSPLAALGGLGLWLLRLLLAARSTLTQFRQWVIEVAPVAPGRSIASMEAAKAKAAAAAAWAESADVQAASCAQLAEVRTHAETAIAAARADATAAMEQHQAALAQALQDRDAAHAAELAELAARQEGERAAAAERLQRVQAQQDQSASAREQQLREQLTSVEQQYQTRLESASAENESALQAAERRYAELRETSTAELGRWQHEREELASEVDRLRGERDRVMGAASGKARLIALYERLGEAGDPRYGSRDAVAEVARELREPAGLASDGTARAYLGEHLATLANPQHGQHGQRVMNGVN